jgi:hypothetical protein
MSNSKTPGEYAAQTRKWREQFDPNNVLSYAAQVEEADRWIERIEQSDPALYNEFMSGFQVYGGGGLGWNPKDFASKQEAEAKERAAPVVPALSGRTHDNGAFIALNMSTADGVLQTAMEHAMSTGDIDLGYIISAHSNTKWRYEVTCVDYDANALTVPAILGKVSKIASVEHNVNSELVTHSSITGISYRKKGTCKVRIAYEGTTNVKASDSPQYNDGKERIPVAYTV